MISYLKGSILEKNTENVIVLNNNIGYEISVPLSYLNKLSEGEDIELFTHMNVREDSWQLFGFLTREEKEFFTILISVSGIGPKSAIGILSKITTNELLGALANEDMKLLTSLPGVGKKTAQRLIFELRGKLPSEIDTNQDSIDVDKELERNIFDALRALGYESSEINKVLPKVFVEEQNKTESSLIKLALKYLAKSI